MPEKKPPFFTIIIPTFNSVKTLDATLQSLNLQSFENFEIIISDGNSQDGTTSIIENYEKLKLKTTISSRPDKGVYDAINKAIDLSTGNWIYILGSDDTLFSNLTLNEASIFLEKTEESLIYGDVCVSGYTKYLSDGQIYDGNFSTEKLLLKNICQQAIFYRKDIFQKIGYFNINYKICADWDFALRAFSKVPTKYISTTICKFTAGGLSYKVTDSLFNLEKPLNIISYYKLKTIGTDFINYRWDFYKLSLHLRSSGKKLKSITPLLIFLTLSIKAKFNIKTS